MTEAGKYFITGGKILNANKASKVDIAVVDGKIAAFGRLNPEEYQDFRTILAKGKLIFPGGIDPHVHMALPTPAGLSSDNFYTGSLAAIAGGTTSIIDFVTPKRGQSLLEALDLRRKEAESSLCDYKLHMGISEWKASVKKEIKQCILKENIRSFKAYLAYRDSIGITLDQLKSLMEVIAEEGCLLLVHCEDGDLIKDTVRKLLRSRKTHAAYHGISRPAEAEILAIKSVIELASETKCRTYIVHTSTSEGGRLIREAKEEGIPVYGETCMQYLVLDDEVYDESLPNFEVLPFVFSPPLRSIKDQQLLWKEVTKGTFDTMGSDHCPFNLSGQKDIGNDNFSLVPSGAGGVEYRIPLLFSHGVLSHLITNEQFVAMTSTNAAKLFGWERSKGKIAAGFDADLVIWDPEPMSIINRVTQKQHCDSNIFEGIPVTGRVEKVISRGKLYEF